MLRPSGPWHEEQTCTVPATVVSALPPSVAVPLHAATSTTSAGAAGIERVRQRAFLSRISLSALALAGTTSEGKPGISEDGVVVPGVTTGAVIICHSAVELVVMHVLQPELHIEPRPEVRAAVIERNVIKLES